MPTGTDLIRADHKRVNALFEEFAETNDATLVGQIIDALTAHDQAEHAALYPLAGATLGDPELLRSYEAAHMLVKRQIDALRSTEDAALVEAVEVLRALVTEHVQDEEQNLLPALDEAATPDQLQGLAARIEQNKQRVG
jgi:hemerythrin superfamily protein